MSKSWCSNCKQYREFLWDSGHKEFRCTNCGKKDGWHNFITPNTFKGFWVTIDNVIFAIQEWWRGKPCTKNPHFTRPQYDARITYGGPTGPKVDKCPVCGTKEQLDRLGWDRCSEKNELICSDCYKGLPPWQH